MSMRAPVSKEPAATRSSHQPSHSMCYRPKKVQSMSIGNYAGFSGIIEVWLV